jgi:transcriptional regulator with XRE-family HTH domain
MNFLAVYRKSKKLTQWDVASIMKVSDTLISKWETNKIMPTNEELVKLSEIYGVGIKKLFPDLFGEGGKNA